MGDKRKRDLQRKQEQVRIIQKLTALWQARPHYSFTEIVWELVIKSHIWRQGDKDTEDMLDFALAESAIKVQLPTEFDWRECTICFKQFKCHANSTRSTCKETCRISSYRKKHPKVN